MVQQNPQPEIYMTRHAFAAATVQGTNVTQQIFTNQSHSEEVRLYAVMVQIVSDAVATAGDDWMAGAAVNGNDHMFDISVQSGANNIPPNPIDAAPLQRYVNFVGPANQSSRIEPLSAPVLITHRQPLQVDVTWRGTPAGGPSGATPVSVVVTLIGEMYISEA
tara:strand:+ start:957 stop:1445 length:489 start_codon:yes stop_codon:yes gene_type:complete